MYLVYVFQSINDMECTDILLFYNNMEIAVIARSLLGTGAYGARGRQGFAGFTMGNIHLSESTVFGVLANI